MMNIAGLNIAGLNTTMTMPNWIGNTQEAQEIQKNKLSKFENKFLNFVDNMEAVQGNTETQVYELLTTGQGNTHDVLVALQKAESSIKTAAQIRDKFTEGFQEIMRMQL